MAQSLATGDARLQIVVPQELKEKLRHMAAGRGKKISALVRESIEEKIRELEREAFEEKMREAYLDMADENVETAEDFRYSDAENL
jgi:predicted DNA-binding protein